MTMITRRHFVEISTIGAAAALVPSLVRAAGVKRVVLVHGRSQQGRSSEAIRTEWNDALNRGLKATRHTLPSDIVFSVPFYGDILDGFVAGAGVPLVSALAPRGTAQDEEFLAFQAEILQTVTKSAGVTDVQVDAEYGDNPRPRGVQNQEWVQAMLRALDKYGRGIGSTSLQIFMRDVFGYCSVPGIRDEINRVVNASLTTEPTLVIGHSLGSVVAYNVLCTDTRALNVPVLITVGSPLGIRAVRTYFRPLRRPKVGSWFNAYDKRDVVALYPLDSDNFPVEPAIRNISTVQNSTENRHSIAGYLDDPTVVEWIAAALK